MLRKKLIGLIALMAVAVLIQAAETPTPRPPAPFVPNPAALIQVEFPGPRMVCDIFITCNGLNNGTLVPPPYGHVVTIYGDEAWVEISNGYGNPPPSIRTQVDGIGPGGIGVAGLTIYTDVPTTAQISVEHLYYPFPGDSLNNVAYVQLDVVTSAGVRKIFIIRDDTRDLGWIEIYDLTSPGAPTACTFPGIPAAPDYICVNLGSLSETWASFYSGVPAMDFGVSGRIVNITLAVVDFTSITGRNVADFAVHWDNLRVVCPPVGGFVLASVLPWLLVAAGVVLMVFSIYRRK